MRWPPWCYRAFGSPESRDVRRDDDLSRDPRLIGDHRDVRRKDDRRDARRDDDPRDEREIADISGSLLVRRAPSAIIGVAFALLGLSLVAEPDRWTRTPAYNVLFDFADQQVWGTILLAISATLTSAMWLTRSRTVSLAAHFVAILFTAGWAIAFAVRYKTDSAHSTTPMNAVMWGLVVLPVLVFSLVTTAKYRQVPPAQASDYEP
jgi:hypothetical protein